MPGVLLDTHVVSLLLGGSGKALSKDARDALQASVGQLFTSAITAHELAMLQRDGKVRLARPVEQLGGVLRQRGITTIDLSWEVCAQAVTLNIPDRTGTGQHQDPFDRLHAATALHHGMALITADDTLPNCPGLNCIW